MPEMRQCPGCGRSYDLSFCKKRVRKDKVKRMSAGQKSFKCECGDVPYREREGVEVTNPRIMEAAKKAAAEAKAASDKVLADARAKAKAGAK